MILEIALGIVLAVIILSLLPLIIAAGVAIAGIAIGLGALALAIWLLFAYPAQAGVFIGIAVTAGAFHLLALWIEKRTHMPSVFVWYFTFFGLLALAMTVVLGIGAWDALKTRRMEEGFLASLGFLAAIYGFLYYVVRKGIGERLQRKKAAVEESERDGAPFIPEARESK